MITNFREVGRDVSVASSAARSSSRYSFSHPFFYPSPWCVCLLCLVKFPHSHFQWIRPPNIIIGGNNGTVSLYCIHRLFNSDVSDSLVASCGPGSQCLKWRIPSKYGYPYWVCTFNSHEALIVTCIFQSRQSQLLFCQAHARGCPGELWCMYPCRPCADISVAFLYHQQHPDW
jgi:hypothetical protein